MIRLQRQLLAQWIGIAALAAIVFGWFFSPAVITIGTILLFCNIALYPDLLVQESIQHGRLIYGPALLFVFYIISGLYSDDLTWYMDRCILYAPLAALPIGILSIPNFHKRFRPMLMGIVLIALISIIMPIWVYLSSLSDITTRYGQGNVIPTPFMHIRYSLFLTLSIFSSLFIAFEKQSPQYQKITFGIIAILLTAVLHVLAVRTGLAAFYGGLIIAVIAYIIQSKRYVIGGGAILGILIVCIIAVQTIPTLKKKLHYTTYSLEKILAKGERIDNLSDSYRVASISAGIHIGNQSPLIGRGIGDIKHLTKSYIEKNYPSLGGNIFTPQSQYIITYAGLGLLGILALLFLNIYPIHLGRSSFFTSAIFGALFTVFIVEQIMETQLGISIAMWFYAVYSSYILLLKDRG